MLTLVLNCPSLFTKIKREYAILSDDTLGTTRERVKSLCACKLTASAGWHVDWGRESGNANGKRKLSA